FTAGALVVLRPAGLALAGAGPEAAEPDVVVPKPSGQAPEGVEAAAPVPARRGRKTAAKKATRKRPGKRAKKAAAPAEPTPAAEPPLAAESAAAGQPDVDEAAVSAEPIAEPTPRKAARRPPAKVAAAPPDEAAAFVQALSGVSGLGPAKIGDLAQRFGSLERLRAASTADLVAVPGISETLARRIGTALARQEPAAAPEPASARPAGRKTTRAPAVKKAAARQAPAKRVSARKAAAKRAAAGASQRAEFAAALSDVSGLGPARIGDLAERFGSLDRLRAASTAELVAVPGISEMLARRIQRSLR
ncbi:MAG TPA: helix-hairpin-helix domain-containing protein, partial [Egibacteraceae bacterium]|nr:helix-hairpin-helix domain-containing protein [Egibacteraceae bacterium]